MKDRKIAWERWVDEVIEDEDVDSSEDSEIEPNFELMPLMIRTPIGNYNPIETMSPSRMFDCWFCHTNFDLTEADKNALDLVDGVEVLKIVSRYRFFIGIGKMFSLTEVRPLVEMALAVNQQTIISQIILEISGKKRWAIGIYEDGSYRSITSDTEKDEAYELRLKELKVSGVVNILTSDEV